MKYAVYWDAPKPNEECETRFFKTEIEARKFCESLMQLCESQLSEENGLPNWDITLLRVIAEATPAVYDGGTLKLKEIA